MPGNPAQSVGLLRWCGIALVPAGVLMVVATLLHPSRETATTIIASEAGLIAAHFLYTLAWLLVLLVSATFEFGADVTVENEATGSSS